MKGTTPALFAAALLLTGCGGDTDTGTGTVSSSPSPRETEATQPARDLVVDIAIADGSTSPQGDRVDAKVGQKITLRISSDVAEEIHVHSDPEHTYRVGADDEVEKSFTVEKPGQVAVEAHELGVTIVQLVVRP